MQYVVSMWIYRRGMMRASQGFTYFHASLGLGLPSSAQPCLKAMSAFILAVFLEEREAAQQLCLEASLMEV